MSFEELCASILDTAPATLTDATSQETLASWDSMAQINLITALEETYGVTFSTDEIQSATSLGVLRRMLRGKGAAV